MAGSLRLEIFYDSEPAFCVPEYAEIELRVTNTDSQQTLTNCSIRVGSQILKSWAELTPAQTWSFSYNVSDLVGELGFEAIAFNKTEKNKVTQNVEVFPQKISLEELIFIKTARLPTLLTRLDAPNRLQLSYDDNNSTPPFDFFSLEYTAEKLEYFSRQLLEQGLDMAILNHLHYVTPSQLQNGVGVIQGQLDWTATLKTWLNQPVLAGYQHYWSQNPKFYGTPPNWLLISFNLALANELKRLVHLAQKSPTKSPHLKARLPQLLERANQHTSLIQNSVLAQFVDKTELYQTNPEWLNLLKQLCNNAFNPAYQRLLSLWQEYQTNYVKLPAEPEDAMVTLQPLSKIYELWAVCEIAFALDLKYQTNTSAKGGFCFQTTTDRGKTSLFYNRALSGGWYSSSRPGLPRPDIRLEIASPNPQQIFFDVKYRVNKATDGTSRAKSDDMYKMLAYMHDFEARIGGIIYPGASQEISALVIAGHANQKLIELALRPLLTQPQTITANLQAQLRKSLIIM